MPLRLTEQFRAIVLMVVLALGGAGPAFDAIVFHSVHAGRVSSSHIEQQAGCGEHGERCTIAASFPRPQLYARRVLPFFGRAREVLVAWRSIAAARRCVTASALHARAPPALLV